MSALSTYLHLVESRAETLAMLVAVGFFVGELLARGPFTHALTALGTVTRKLGHKLDREHRSIATRVYRGITAVLMLVFPAIMLAAALGQPVGWLKLLAALLLITWFGHCFSTLSSIAHLRRAKQSGLPLELPNLDYLFADSHAVIRYLIARRVDGFTIGVVGGCFWYVAGGLVAMAIYLTLASAHHTYQQRAAFGWAARSLFLLANALPALIARLLTFLASLFTPHTKPFAGLFATNGQTALANTLHIALGGPMPGGETPWVGTGSARLTLAHLQRAMHLLTAATVVLVLLLAHNEFHKILITII